MTTYKFTTYMLANLCIFQIDTRWGFLPLQLSLFWWISFKQHAIYYTDIIYKTVYIEIDI